MPSSPLTAEIIDRESALAKRLAELDALIDQGVGLSGHERNCAFLNVSGANGERRFATASAAFGLDFEDDARAPALVDWDRDGDLDLWMVNRTAPMLRFARNNGTHENAWLALRLQGTQTNRDGIGSRVEIRLTNGKTLTQTLKAGEGFLSQSSKWLHFGLGNAPVLEEILVKWASGKVESFAGVTLNKRYHLVEGKGAGQENASPNVAQHQQLQLNLAPPGTSVRAVSASRPPLPRLPYTTFAGEKKHAGTQTDGLTLVNLWATWCQPCLAELQAFSQSARAFEVVGITVLPLSVDGLASPELSDEDPATFYQKLKPPFEGGRASAELVRRLELAYAVLYGPCWPLPVPTSALLDQEGNLLAMYQGAVMPSQVLADAKGVSLSLESRHDASLPFAGRWMFRPQPLDPLGLAIDLMDHDQLEAAIELATRARPVYRERGTEYSKLLTWIGDALMKRGRAKESLGAYRAALKEDETATLVLNNLAWQLAAHPDPAIRDGKEAVRWASKAAALTKHTDPAILDTLAAGYAESGDFKQAAQVAEKAADLAKRQGNRALWEGIQQGLRKYRAGKSYTSP
ncbi:ASPIC/UnbV domain-containing protein [Verrucomicrobiales bacterium]|nr:ASPIC/UnbV domain-containing protein [Verrucomicrobiales bacterium]